MTASRNRIYLDHNASAPLCAEARDAMMAALDRAGNPSSTHAEGRAARARVEAARREVAALLGTTGEHVVFTSGASEAATTCLVPDWTAPNGAARRFERLAVLATDHACLRAGGRFAPDAVDELPVDRNGVADSHALDVWLACNAANGLLAFTGANNETGVVQPVASILDRAKAAGSGVVVDAVQMAGRLDLADLATADAVLLSGHKIGAPKGVGAFVLGSVDRRPLPLVTGGTQQTRQRAGTEAVELIAAFGAAAGACAATHARAGDMALLRDRLESRLLRSCPDLLILGRDAKRLPQTSAIVVPGSTAETALMRFDLDGFAVSAGSACGSGKIGRSAVLAALALAGLEVDPERGLVRLSFGVRTTQAELDAFADAFERMAATGRQGRSETRAA